MEEKAQVINYVGKFAFIERIEGSGCYDGEYFIVMQTPHNLYGIKLIGGYGGHEQKKFPLVGKEAHKVISVYKDDEAARLGIKAMKDWAGAISRGEKLAWIPSVYTKCAANARMAERALSCVCPESTESRKLVATIHIYSDGSYGLA